MSDTFREPDGWNERRVERAKALWAEGQSADQISADIGGGISRSAVLGKIHRLGLCRGKSPRRTKTRTNADNPIKMRLPRREPESVRAIVAPKSKSSRRSGPVEVKPVRFLDRRMHVDCSVLLNHGAPVEQLMCCGAPIPEGSSFDFCAGHQALFLIASERRSPRGKAAAAGRSGQH